MSWIFSIDGDELVNLDRIENIEIFPTSDEAGKQRFAVIAQYQKDGEVSVWLFTGSEDECRAKLAAIASKLHLIKV